MFISALSASIGVKLLSLIGDLNSGEASKTQERLLENQRTSLFKMASSKMVIFFPSILRQPLI